MSFSDYLENEILDHIFGYGAYTAPSMIYLGLALFPQEWGGGGSHGELPDVKGYTRVATTPANWTTATEGIITNASVITFPTATGGDWGWVDALTFLDSGGHGLGNFLMYAQLIPSLKIEEGDEILFQIGQIEITLE